LVVLADHRLDQRAIAGATELRGGQADLVPEGDQRPRIRDVAVLSEIRLEQAGMYPLEGVAPERGRRLGDQVRGHAVRRGPSVALPDTEGWRAGPGGRPDPALRVRPELVEGARPVRVRAQEVAPPLELHLVAELLAQPVEARCSDVAPGAQVVRPDDQANRRTHHGSTKGCCSH